MTNEEIVFRECPVCGKAFAYTDVCPVCNCELRGNQNADHSN